MVFQFLFAIFLCVSACLAVALAVQVIRSRRYLRFYRTTLESAQKQADAQTARLNLLCRVVPNLPVVVSAAGDAWQNVVLDDLRALLRADGACYWAYSERERELVLQSARGTAAGAPGTRARIDGDEGAACLAARSRLPVARTERDEGSGPVSVLAVPMMQGGALIAVLRLIRHGEPALTAADGDLVLTYAKVLALALENRNMATNREKFYLELVQTLADILDSRDASTLGQTRRARRLSRAIAEEMEMPEEFIYYLEFAALMHDIGKIAIDESLLKKPGKLTDQEFEVVKKHPELGYKILSPVTMLAPVAPMVLYHQEWFNGKGYPEGLSGEEIPLGARIVAVLDAWCAMTSARPWRPAMSNAEAVREITRGAGTQFDPRVVEAFLAVIDGENALAEAS